jgi:spermidine synthase
MTREIVLPNKSYKNVLIIGGGDLLIAGYILEKFPLVQKVVLCELDERVVKVTEKYFGLPRNIE